MSNSSTFSDRLDSTRSLNSALGETFYGEYPKGSFGNTEMKGKWLVDSGEQVLNQVMKVTWKPLDKLH